jgi:hypothetical protein
VSEQVAIELQADQWSVVLSAANAGCRHIEPELCAPVEIALSKLEDQLDAKG